MNQSFSYNGPKSLTEDRDCGLCATVARKKCPIPESDDHRAPQVGCSHCDAVKSGLCPSHCGVENAVKSSDLDPKLAEFVLGQSVNLPEGTVHVHVRAHEPEGDVSADYGVSVDISLRPS